jgi:hypothetical protein
VGWPVTQHRGQIRLSLHRNAVAAAIFERTRVIRGASLWWVGCR